MSNKGFSSVLLIFIFLIVVSGIVGFLFLPQYLQKTAQEKLPSTEVQPLQIGESHIVVYPGRSHFSLPSGARIYHGHGQGENSVPDFTYGDRYTINDIHNINYIGIYGKLVTYHNGYKYDITNEGCETAQRDDIDMVVTVVTKCNLKIITSEEPAPVLTHEDYSKSFVIVENGNAVTGLHSQPGEPLLYAEARPIRVSVSKVTAEKPYISPGTDWDISVITNYGIETIRYTPEELANMETKSGTAGAQEINVSIDNLACDNLGITDPKLCPYFTILGFTISQKGLVDTPISILEYK